MIVKWEYKVGFTESPDTLVVSIWRPRQAPIKTPRRPFKEIADMSDAERERWLFPYVARLAEEPQSQTGKP
jgi:hypothetical protein